jgi:hypothetical protein
MAVPLDVDGDDAEDGHRAVPYPRADRCCCNEKGTPKSTNARTSQQRNSDPALTQARLCLQHRAVQGIGHLKGFGVMFRNIWTFSCSIGSTGDARRIPRLANALTVCRALLSLLTNGSRSSISYVPSSSAVTEATPFEIIARPLSRLFFSVAYDSLVRYPFGRFAKNSQGF